MIHEGAAAGGVGRAVGVGVGVVAAGAETLAVAAGLVGFAADGRRALRGCMQRISVRIGHGGQTAVMRRLAAMQGPPCSHARAAIQN